MGSHSGQLDKSDCDKNYLQKQPALTAEASIHQVDFQLVMLPLAEIRFEASYPELIPPITLRDVPEPFSDRLFSSYRLLLI